MARDYSKGGCLRCKKIRKKCDETRPSCLACTRKQLVCEYVQAQAQAQTATRIAAAATATVASGTAAASQPTTNGNNAAVATFKEPQNLVKLLPAARFRPYEELVIARIQPAITSFFARTCGTTNQNLNIMMKLIFEEGVVRDSVVSCFSAIMQSENQKLDELHESTLGSALRSVLSQLNDPNPSFEKLSILQVAIQYLGLMESVGKQHSPDPTTHWMALATLTKRTDRKGRDKKPVLPYNIQLLLLEAAVYHFAALAPFTSNIRSMQAVWRNSDVWSRLIEHSSRGRDRLSDSLLMCGQYELWRFAWEVISEHRTLCSDDRVISSIAIGRRKRTIKRFKAGMPDFFLRNQDADTQSKEFLLGMYQLQADSLLITYLALERDTPARAREINEIVAGGLQNFLKWPLGSRTPSYVGGCTWAVQMLACAISEDSDWNAFQAQARMLEAHLDPGHWRRTRQVLERVSLARSDPKWRIDSTLPGSLFLIQQPEGILHARKRVQDV